MILNVSSNLKHRSSELTDIDAGKILAEKAAAFDEHIRPMLEDLTKYEIFLRQVKVCRCKVYKLNNPS